MSLMFAAVFGCVCGVVAAWVDESVLLGLDLDHAASGVDASGCPEVPGAMADEADLACASPFVDADWRCGRDVAMVDRAVAVLAGVAIYIVVAAQDDDAWRGLAAVVTARFDQPSVDVSHDVGRVDSVEAKGLLGDVGVGDCSSGRGPCASALFRLICA